MRNALAAGMAVGLTLALSAAVCAAMITVNSVADVGTPGICVLRDAITAANTKTAANGCVAGTGNDTINFSVTGTIALGSTLPQVTDGLLTINGPTSPGITIDGGGKVQVMVVALGATLNLNNLTIADGSGIADASNGGGIHNDGSLTVSNSMFFNNTNFCCSGGGAAGAIDNERTLSVINSVFAGNSAINSAGGIFNGGSLTVVNSSFEGNFTRTGGGILNGGSLTVIKSSFLDNIAGSGGGIENQGSLAVINSTFSGNESDEGGGGIDDATEATVNIESSSFFSNTSKGGLGGGGISIPEGTVTITGSVFANNSSYQGGGGLANYGTVTLTNSTFSGNNSTTSGGGIFNAGLRLTVTNSTFFGNSSGIYQTSFSSSSFKSTIFAASTVAANCSDAIVDAGYNISDDNSCGFAKTGSANNGDGVNPLLSPDGLHNNGGPTETIALSPGSPAIDVIPLANCGDQASPPNPIITDQRLFPRPDAGEAKCDIGAYEVQDTSLTHFSPFSGSLRIDPDAGVFYLNGRFELSTSATFDPTTQPVAFSVGSYAVRLPAGSFVKNETGYVYQKTVNGIYLCLLIKFTSTSGSYVLQANRTGGTLSSTTSPVLVTLTVGNNTGSTQMNATFN